MMTSILVGVIVAAGVGLLSLLNFSLGFLVGRLEESLGRAWTVFILCIFLGVLAAVGWHLLFNIQTSN